MDDNDNDDSQVGGGEWKLGILLLEEIGTYQPVFEAHFETAYCVTIVKIPGDYHGYVSTFPQITFQYQGTHLLLPTHFLSQ